MFIADFSYVEIPKEDFFFGMYTRTVECFPVGADKPKDFEAFNFIIDKAPDHNFDIFNIESY